MKKFVIASLLAGAASGFILAGGPVTAAAAETHTDCVQFDSSGNIVGATPGCTESIKESSPPQTMPSSNPCTGDPGMLTIYTKQSMLHLNVNNAGDIWITSTQNGTATFVPDDSSLPVWNGTWTSWFGGSLNRSNAVIHDTFSSRVHDGLGDTITQHMVDHLSFSASGAQNTFSIASTNCG